MARSSNHGGTGTGASGCYYFQPSLPVRVNGILYTHGHDPASIVYSHAHTHGRDASASGSTDQKQDLALRPSSSSSSSFPSSSGLGRPSHRQKHLRKTYDIFHLSLLRSDPIRASRALRILVRSHEWRAGELWRFGLGVVGMRVESVRADERGGAAGEGEGSEGGEDRRRDQPLFRRARSGSGWRSGSDSDGAEEEDERDKLQRRGAEEDQRAREREQERESSERRIGYLKKIALKHVGLRVEILHELVLELIAVERYREALDAIERVLTSFPYRNEPALHTYAGLLTLYLSTPRSATSTSASAPTVSPLGPVSTALPQSTDASSLRAAQRHFETALRSSAHRSEIESRRAEKRARWREGRVEKARKRARGKRARSRSRSVGVWTEEGESGEEEREEEGGEEEESGEGESGEQGESAEWTDQSGEEGRTGRGERTHMGEQGKQARPWAVQVAHTYLELIRKPPPAPAPKPAANPTSTAPTPRRRSRSRSRSYSESGFGSGSDSR